MNRISDKVRLHIAAYSTFLSMKWMIKSNSQNDENLFTLMNKIKKISDACLFYAVNQKIPSVLKNRSDKVNKSLGNLYQEMSRITDPVRKTIHIIAFMELTNLLQQDIAVTMKIPNWIILHKEMKYLMENYFLSRYPESEELGINWYYEIFLGEIKNLSLDRKKRQ